MAVSETEGFYDVVTNTRECADSRNKVSESISETANGVLTQEEMEKLGGEVLVSDFKQIKLEKEAQKNWDLFYKRNTTNFFKNRHWTTREFEELKACREVSRWMINPGRLTEVAVAHNHKIALFVFQNSLEKSVNFKRDGLKDSHQGHINFPVDDCFLLKLAVLSLACLVCSLGPRGWCCWRLAVVLEIASFLCWRTTSTCLFTPATSHRELLNLSRFGAFIKVNRKLWQLY